MHGIDLRFLFIMYIPQSNPGACLLVGDLLRQSPRNNAWTSGSLNSDLEPLERHLPKDENRPHGFFNVLTLEDVGCLDPS